MLPQLERYHNLEIKRNSPLDLCRRAKKITRKLGLTRKEGKQQILPKMLLKIKERKEMDIEKTIKQMVQLQFGLLEFPEKNKTIIDDLGGDLLDMVEIAKKIERYFEIEISDKEFKKLKTVNDLIKLTTKKGV